jgi:hypothetical protein
MKNVIVIPSYKRAEYLMQDRRYNTLKWLSEEKRVITHIAVREEELEAYKPVAEKYGCSLAPLYPSEEPYGVKETRRDILRQFLYVVSDNVLMIDDDLLFERKIDEQGLYRTDGAHPFDEAFEWLTSTTNVEPLRGLTSRGFAHSKKEMSGQDKGVIQCFALRAEALRADRELWDFTLAPGPYMSDYWFNLNLLAKGYHTRMSYAWCKCDEPRIVGGCEATGRTIEKVNASAIALKKMFPEVITLRQKETKFWGPSIGVTVAWKQAFNLYDKRHQNNLSGAR